VRQPDCVLSLQIAVSISGRAGSAQKSSAESPSLSAVGIAAAFAKSSIVFLYSPNKGQTYYISIDFCERSL
jgi:hypothetical protein